jgi:predicted ATP-dependent protease
MKQFIAAFIYNWSPWHLRKRVAKLERTLARTVEDNTLSMRQMEFCLDDKDRAIKDYKRYIEKNKEQDVLDNEAYQRVVEENERLTKENERLLNQMDSVVSVFETHASILKQCGIICEGHANTLKRICDKGDHQ